MSTKMVLQCLHKFIDIAVVNAWIIIIIVSETPAPLLKFKHSLARYYLHTSASTLMLPGRPKIMYARALPDIRYDPIWHRLERTQEGKQRKKSVSSASNVMLAFTWEIVNVHGIQNKKMILYTSNLSTCNFIFFHFVLHMYSLYKVLSE